MEHDASDECEIYTRGQLIQEVLQGHVLIMFTCLKLELYL